MTHTNASDVLASEEQFHDRWAKNFDPASVLVDESFTYLTCPENLFIQKELGDLKGKRLLELGTGLGEAGVHFAKMGADVVATDLSGGMLQLTAKVAALHGVTMSYVQTDAARLDFPDASFDVVYGANVLHHVDTAQCLKEVRRVLKPGGRGAFWDPIRYNPIINVYRRMANQVRSEDEHPLGMADLKNMQEIFSDVRVNFFWFNTLAVFLKFYFVDQIHPNQERYWKKIIYDYPRFKGFYNPLYKVDRVLLSLPGLRWLAWNMAVVVTK